MSTYETRQHSSEGRRNIVSPNHHVHLSDLYTPLTPKQEQNGSAECSDNYRLSVLDREKGIFQLDQRMLRLPGQQAVVMLTLHDTRLQAATEVDARVSPQALFTEVNAVFPSAKTRPAQIISSIRTAIGERAETARVIKEAHEGKGNKVVGYWLGIPVDGEIEKVPVIPADEPRKTLTQTDQNNLTAIRLILAFEDISPDLVTGALGKRNGNRLNPSNALLILRNFISEVETSVKKRNAPYEYLAMVNRIRSYTQMDSPEEALHVLREKIDELLRKQ